ncbi:MAG: ribonuclease P protein component [Pseudomonadota bacterium]|nr:ribonuclease P protein component [Pseudomonadota bacterium]
MVNPRLVHLKKRGDFLRVASAQRKFVTPSLILQARPHEHTEVGDVAPLRVGITVTRRVGNAVIRNRVRRRLRAAAENILPQFLALDSDLVIIARQAALCQDYANLTGHLKSALARYQKEKKKQNSIAE